MSDAKVFVEKRDLVGTGRGKPFREFVVSFSLPHAIGNTKYMSVGYKTTAVSHAKELAMRFSKKYRTFIYVADCGAPYDGVFEITNRRIARLK